MAPTLTPEDALRARLAAATTLAERTAIMHEAINLAIRTMRRAAR